MENINNNENITSDERLDNTGEFEKRRILENENSTELTVENESAVIAQDTPVDTGKNKSKEGIRLDKQVREYAVSIAVAIIIALTLRNYVFARADVEGNSMVSTLHNRDVIFVEKVSVLTHSIKRGQIVIFDSKNVNNDIYVKRVIGIEGDEIEIKDGKVYLNGEVLKENYLDTNTYTNTGMFLASKGKYKVPKDHIFVLGDNRGNSLDSRTIGPVSINDIKGHTIFRVYPFNQMRIF